MNYLHFCSPWKTLEIIPCAHGEACQAESEIILSEFME